MIHVEDLPFQTIPASEAENVLKAKNGFLNLGGNKKKFAKCIEEGKAGICEVAVASQFWVEEDDRERPYGVVLTKDDRELCAEGVMCFDEEVFFAMPEAPYGRYDAYRELSDDGKRQAAECKKGFVIHYFLGKDEYYKLIVPKWAEDLKLLVPVLDDNYGYDFLLAPD